MFTFYKKHNNKLYNNLVNLSRNKYFYQEIKLFDDFETRVILLFFHFVIILKVKKNEDLKKNFQLLFDNIFQNIEVNIRELGYGDTKVNKTQNNIYPIQVYSIQKHGCQLFEPFNNILKSQIWCPVWKFTGFKSYSII